MEKRKNRWLIDPSVKRSENHGCPPTGHSRRCQARNRRGTQCGSWALVERNYCPFHGGRTTLTRKRVPNFYSKYAGTKLKEVLERLEKEDDSVRHDLAGEIDIARVSCTEAFKVFDKVIFQGVADNGTPNIAARTAAESYLRACIDHLAKVTETDAKIKSKSLGQVPVLNIKFVCDKLLQIVYKRVEQEAELPDLAKLILGDIENMELADQSTSKRITVNIE